MSCLALWIGAECKRHDAGALCEGRAIQRQSIWCAGLSCLSFVEPNKRDKPDKPDEPDPPRAAEWFQPPVYSYGMTDL